MTDPRTEAARIGFWDEGIGAWDDDRSQFRSQASMNEIGELAQALIRRALILPPTREDAHIDDCD